MGGRFEISFQMKTSRTKSWHIALRISRLEIDDYDNDDDDGNKSD
jgi:hypothetical protein